MRASTVLGTLAAAGAAAGVVRVLDRQFGPPRPDTATRHDWLRRFNKEIANPVALRLAEITGVFPVVIGHDGRTSGRAYETPVVAMPTDAGYVIALPYGAGVDWCRNVIAAGDGTIRVAGQATRFTAPTVIGRAEAASQAVPPYGALLRRFGPAEFLRLDRAASES